MHQHTTGTGNTHTNHTQRDRSYKRRQGFALVSPLPQTPTWQPEQNVNTRVLFCFVLFLSVTTKTPWPCVSRALPLSCLHRLCFSETSWAAMSHLKVVGLNSQEKTSHPPASSACSLFWVQAQQREVRLATSLPCT